MSALQELLKDTFGYDDFRPGQETIIRHVLRQENVLGIMWRQIDLLSVASLTSG